MEWIKRRLDVGLVTADAGAARRFYADVIGLSEEPAREMGGGIMQYRFAFGGQVLKILDYPEKPERAGRGDENAIGYRLLALLIDDYDALIERLRASGRRVGDPLDFAGKIKIGFTRDADGNTLELVGLPNAAGDALKDRIQIGLSVTDVERSRHFYGELLGLPEQPSMRMPNGQTRYAFSAGGTTLKFASAQSAEALPNRAGPVQQGVGIRYVTFMVRGVEALCEELEGRGVKIAMRPRELGGRVRLMFIEDPDGNWIEMAEPLDST